MKMPYGASKRRLNTRIYRDGVVHLPRDPKVWAECNRCHARIPEGEHPGRWLREHKAGACPVNPA